MELSKLNETKLYVTKLYGTKLYGSKSSYGTKWVGCNTYIRVKLQLFAYTPNFFCLNKISTRPMSTVLFTHLFSRSLQNLRILPTDVLPPL